MHSKKLHGLEGSNCHVFQFLSSFFFQNLWLTFFNYRGGGNIVQIVHRHHFASHLKRMAVVVRVQEQFLAFVKV